MQGIMVWIFTVFYSTVANTIGGGSDGPLSGPPADCGCGVGFSAYMSEDSARNQSQEMSNGTILVFDKTTANRNGVYNTITGKFKAPSEGMYAFTWTLCVDSRHSDGGPLNYGEYGTELINGRGVFGYLHADTETRYGDACSTAFVICHVYASEYVYVRNVYAHQGRLLSKERQTRTTFSGWKLFN